MDYDVVIFSYCCDGSTFSPAFGSLNREKMIETKYTLHAHTQSQEDSALCEDIVPTGKPDPRDGKEGVGAGKGTGMGTGTGTGTNLGTGKRGGGRQRAREPPPNHDSSSGLEDMRHRG